MAVYLIVQPIGGCSTSRTSIRLYDEVAPFSIGRSPQALIFLHPLCISRRHAEVRVRNGRLAIRDIGSTNRLRQVSGEPLQPFVWFELHSGDPVEMIGYHLWAESKRSPDALNYENRTVEELLSYLPGPTVQQRLLDLELSLTGPQSPVPLQPLPDYVRVELLSRPGLNPSVAGRLRLMLQNRVISKDADDNLAHLFRDLLGDFIMEAPLSPLVSTWREGLVPCMARTMEQERRYQDLPILADALEEAGCDQAEVLAHLRGPGPHFPGCWAIRWLTARPSPVPLLQ